MRERGDGSDRVLGLYERLIDLASVYAEEPPSKPAYLTSNGWWHHPILGAAIALHDLLTMDKESLARQCRTVPRAPVELSQWLLKYGSTVDRAAELLALHTKHGIPWRTKNTVQSWANPSINIHPEAGILLGVVSCG
jgi:hypothetical protein